MPADAAAAPGTPYILSFPLSDSENGSVVAPSIGSAPPPVSPPVSPPASLPAPKFPNVFLCMALRAT